MMIRYPLVLCLLFSGVARGQTPTAFAPNTLISSAAVNAAFAGKQDVAGDVSGQRATAAGTTLTISAWLAPLARVGVALGLASLDSGSHVPVAQLPVSVQQVALTLGWSGIPAASAISVGPPLLWPCTIPANGGVSQGFANARPTGSPAFAISYVHAGAATSFVTVTYSAGSNYPTLSSFAATHLSAGDVLIGVSPAIADATAADISVSFECDRS